MRATSGIACPLPRGEILPRCVQTAFHRHVQIQERKIVPLAQQRLHRLFPVADDPRLVPRFFQDPPDDHLVDAVVLRHEDPERPSSFIETAFLPGSGRQREADRVEPGALVGFRPHDGTIAVPRRFPRDRFPPDKDHTDPSPKAVPGKGIRKGQRISLEASFGHDRDIGYAARLRDQSDILPHFGLVAGDPCFRNPDGVQPASDLPPIPGIRRDDEHLQLFAGIDPRRRRRNGFSQWDLEPEGGSLPRAADDADLPSHHPDEFPGNGGSQPRAAVPAGDGIVGLREPLEDLLLLLRRHADAGVGHLEADPDAVAFLADDGQPDDDLPFMGELDRVGQQVRQDLPKTGEVADDGTRHLRRHDRPEPGAPCRRAAGKRPRRRFSPGGAGPSPLPR